MRKIRIGTDIRLRLKIEPNTMAGFDRIDEFDQSNVKQLRCYLINTSFCKPCCDHSCKKQKVGFPDFYHPTPYNINNTGFPSFHAVPANICNYDRFSPDFHDFHWWPGYRGFGIYPEHFHEYCGHMHWHGPKPSHFYPHCHNHRGPEPGCVWPEPWYEPFYHGYDHHGIQHCKPEPFDQWLHPEYVPADVFGKENVVLNHPHPYAPYYLCDSQVLNEKNALTCMFPAVQQKMCGTYKLVVVLTVFEQGWGRHNLRTYTIDKGDVFDLVDTETGESGAITIDVDSTGVREDLIDSMYFEKSKYRIADDSTFKIGDFDLDDNQYNLYVKLKDGTVVLYNPDDWRYNKLEFNVVDSDILSVDKKGNLTAAPVDQTVSNIKVEVRDVDWQQNSGTSQPYAYSLITVVPTDNIKIGFDDEANPNNVEGNENWLIDYSTRGRNYYAVHNLVDGDYMWVLSQKRIHYIKSLTFDQDENMIDPVAELSSGFRVPMESYGNKNGYFYYRSVAPIKIDHTHIKIIFE